MTNTFHETDPLDKKIYKRGDNGPQVRKIQEWLGLHGHSVVIDGDYGPATEAALWSFAHTKEVTPGVWQQLIAPMQTAVQPLQYQPLDLMEAVCAVAKQHLTQHPREIGGQNSGPWVRLYTGGHEGAPWAWCAGFVSYIYTQAAAHVNLPMPFKVTLSCDQLAAQAKASLKFITGPVTTIKPGSLFLVRRNARDWVHTGIVTGSIDNHVFRAIEGNANDSGDREGYEVCARIRSFKNLDFFEP